MGWLKPTDVALAASVCKAFASGCATERLWQEQYVRAFGGGGEAREDEGKGEGSVASPAPVSLAMPPCAESKVVRGDDEGESTSTSTSTRKWRQRFARRFRIERSWLSPETDAGRFPSLTLSGHRGEVLAVLVWWERGLVFSGLRSNTIRKWSLETGESLGVFTGHTSSVACLAGDSQTGTLVSGSYDKTVRVWSAASGECLHVLRGLASWVLCVALLPGSIIVSGGRNGEIKVWDGGEGKLLRSITAGTSDVYAVVSDGKRIVSGNGRGNGDIRIFDMKSGACTEVLFHAPKSVRYLALRDNVLVAGCDDGVLRSWELSVGSASMREYQGGSASGNGIRSLCFQEGVGPTRVLSRRANGIEVELWDVASAQRVSVWQCAPQHWLGQQLAADLHRLVCANGKEVKVVDFSG
jgi:WD40 repeat protein